MSFGSSQIGAPTAASVIARLTQYTTLSIGSTVVQESVFCGKMVSIVSPMRALAGLSRARKAGVILFSSVLT
jgi:hypothetical protein